jgi:hypothetical protein
MSEELLHGTNVLPAFKQMGREALPESVAT